LQAYRQKFVVLHRFRGTSAIYWQVAIFCSSPVFIAHVMGDPSEFRDSDICEPESRAVAKKLCDAAFCLPDLCSTWNFWGRSTRYGIERISTIWQKL